MTRKDRDNATLFDSFIQNLKRKSRKRNINVCTRLKHQRTKRSQVGPKWTVILTSLKLYPFFILKRKRSSTHDIYSTPFPPLQFFITHLKYLSI
ncbi:hypothetical protein TcasGA2_TC013638 [Tribolium castaneum]|uniref:Uncharacterized protein n=1 Tax=Tribolium castaneum TaxID=7070 RepID=D6W6U8_TRICA|nr:hypothetical protein TcasGA2_TC013638 [Tribolium castaneum]